MNIVDLNLTPKERKKLHKCPSHIAVGVRPGQAFECGVCHKWWYAQGWGDQRITFIFTPRLWYKSHNQFVKGPC